MQKMTEVAVAPFMNLNGALRACTASTSPPIAASMTIAKAKNAIRFFQCLTTPRVCTDVGVLRTTFVTHPAAEPVSDVAGTAH